MFSFEASSEKSIRPLSQNPLLEDWYHLLLEAKKIGLSVEEVRNFIIKAGKN